MMMSLFSVFDPLSYMGQFNWMIMIIPLYLLFYNKFMLSGLFGEFFFMLCDYMMKMFMLLSWPYGRGIVLFIVSMFMFLSIENFLGLFPFVFSSTAHPLITLGMGVVGWLICFLMGWMKNFFISSAHMVPEGSPLMLSFLLVIIESISHLIRPFTLSIRLAANMMAGHLIVGLISSISLFSFKVCIVSIMLQCIILILESGVAVVQALVFSILLLLYVVEYY